MPDQKEREELARLRLQNAEEKTEYIPGIISEFRKTYIKTGVFSEELSDIIGELFAVRTNSDYDDFYVLSKEKALAQYQNAVVFVDAVKKYFGEIGLL